MDFPVPRDFDIALFFERLWLLLNEPRWNHILQWRRGEAKFAILNDQRMQLDICPLLFQLCSWSNFLQTLYACKFRRGRQGLEFFHEVFTQRRLQALTREQRHELFRTKLGYKASRLTDRNPSDTTWEQWLGPEILIRSITNAAGNVQVSIITPVEGQTPLVDGRAAIAGPSNLENVTRPRTRKNVDPRRYEGEEEIVDVENVSSEYSSDELPRSTPTQRGSPSGSSTLISEQQVSDEDSNRNEDPTNDQNAESTQQTDPNNEGQEQESAETNEDSSSERSGNNDDEEPSGNGSDNNDVEEPSGDGSDNNDEEPSRDGSDNNDDEESSRDGSDNNEDEESSSDGSDNNVDEEPSVSGTNTDQESSNQADNSEDQGENESQQESTNRDSSSDGEETSSRNEASNQESNNGEDEQDPRAGNDTDEDSSSDSSSSSEDSSNEDSSENEEPQAAKSPEKPRRPRKPVTPTKYRRGNQDITQPSTSATGYESRPGTSADSENIEEQSKESKRDPIILRIPKVLLKKKKKKKRSRDE